MAMNQTISGSSFDLDLSNPPSFGSIATPPEPAATRPKPDPALTARLRDQLKVVNEGEPQPEPAGKPPLWRRFRMNEETAEEWTVGLTVALGLLMFPLVGLGMLLEASFGTTGVILAAMVSVASLVGVAWTYKRVEGGVSAFLRRKPANGVLIAPNGTLIDFGGVYVPGGMGAVKINWRIPNAAMTATRAHWPDWRWHYLALALILAATATHTVRGVGRSILFTHENVITAMRHLANSWDMLAVEAGFALLLVALIGRGWLLRAIVDYRRLPGLVDTGKWSLQDAPWEYRRILGETRQGTRVVDGRKNWEVERLRDRAERDISAAVPRLAICFPVLVFCAYTLATFDGRAPHPNGLLNLGFLVVTFGTLIGSLYAGGKLVKAVSELREPRNEMPPPAPPRPQKGREDVEAEKAHGVGGFMDPNKVSDAARTASASGKTGGDVTQVFLD